MRLFSIFFSYLLHPLFSPLVCTILLFQLPIYINFKYPEAYFNAVYLCVTLNLILIPLSMSYYLKKQGIIQSLKMHSVEERKYPYAISSIFYLLTFLLFSQINFPEAYLSIFLAASLSVFLLFIFALNKKKVSAHMTGIGGICGLLFVVNQMFGINTVLPISIALLLAGVLAASRLYLQAHNLGQITIGFALGFGCQLLVLFY